MHTKRVAVVLSGCGVFDGSEIHEAVLSLLALHEAGIHAQCFAPNKEQMHVVDHVSGDVTADIRNVLTESARIARGKIEDLANLKVEEFDAVFLPGGFGAAKNLSTFATEGAAMHVDPEVSRVLTGFRAANKAIAALCIAPTILAKLFPGASLTLGADGDAAQAATAMGAAHTVTTHGEVVVDTDKRLVTSPCYMLNADIGHIRKGTQAAVKALSTLL